MLQETDQDASPSTQPGARIRFSLRALLVTQLAAILLTSMAGALIADLIKNENLIVIPVVWLCFPWAVLYGFLVMPSVSTGPPELIAALQYPIIGAAHTIARCWVSRRKAAVVVILAYALPWIIGLLGFSFGWWFVGGDRCSCGGS